MVWACADSSEAFNKVRKLLEDCGIVVMMNGIVGKNTHRVLDVNEFRAFAMVNEWAPLIFIMVQILQVEIIFLVS